MLPAIPRSSRGLVLLSVNASSAWTTTFESGLNGALVVATVATFVLLAGTVKESQSTLVSARSLKRKHPPVSASIMAELLWWLRALP